MFLNCNEEIKRQKERTIRNQNMLAGRICSRLKDWIRDRLKTRLRQYRAMHHFVMAEIV